MKARTAALNALLLLAALAATDCRTAPKEQAARPRRSNTCRARRSASH